MAMDHDDDDEDEGDMFNLCVQFILVGSANGQLLQTKVQSRQ